MHAPAPLTRADLFHAASLLLDARHRAARRGARREAADLEACALRLGLAAGALPPTPAMPGAQGGNAVGRSGAA